MKWQITNQARSAEFYIPVQAFLATWVEGGKGGIVIPFHAQILTKFTLHVLSQSLSEKPQGNEIFKTKHK